MDPLTPMRLLSSDPTMLREQVRGSKSLSTSLSKLSKKHSTYPRACTHTKLRGIIESTRILLLGLFKFKAYTPFSSSCHRRILEPTNPKPQSSLTCPFHFSFIFPYIPTLNRMSRAYGLRQLNRGKAGDLRTETPPAADWEMVGGLGAPFWGALCILGIITPTIDSAPFWVSHIHEEDCNFWRISFRFALSLWSECCTEALLHLRRWRRRRSSGLSPAKRSILLESGSNLIRALLVASIEVIGPLMVALLGYS